MNDSTLGSGKDQVADEEAKYGWRRDSKSSFSDWTLRVIQTSDESMTKTTEDTTQSNDHRGNEGSKSQRQSREKGMDTSCSSGLLGIGTPEKWIFRNTFFPRERYRGNCEEDFNTGIARVCLSNISSVFGLYLR